MTTGTRGTTGLTGTGTTGDAAHAGSLLRAWRRRRHLSQLDLAHRAGVSPRHVSFIETGRSRPTSAMILRLCDHLDVPLREQNQLLLAGGFAPAHPHVGLDSPSMAQVSAAIETILTAHLPWPALVLDASWDLVAANEAVYGLLDGVAERLLEPPVNVVDLTLDPEGLAPRIENLPAWRAHLLSRLRREHAVSADVRLAELLRTWDTPAEQQPAGGADVPDLVVPLVLRAGGQRLALISTTTVFGTTREVTLSEIAVEAFWPADEATRSAFGPGATEER